MFLAILPDLRKVAITKTDDPIKLYELLWKEGYFDDIALYQGYTPAIYLYEAIVNTINSNIIKDEPIDEDDANEVIRKYIVKKFIPLSDRKSVTIAIRTLYSQLKNNPDLIDSTNYYVRVPDDIEPGVYDIRGFIKESSSSQKGRG